VSSPTSSRSLCLPPARMHFCVSATRGGIHIGFCCPKKIGTNWFMPALVKSRFGASGNSDDDGTIVCCFSRKKSRNDCRICVEVMAGGSPDRSKLPEAMHISKRNCCLSETPAHLPTTRL